MSSLSVLGFLFLPAFSIDRSCDEIASGVIAEAAADGAGPAEDEGPFGFDVRVNSSFCNVQCKERSYQTDNFQMELLKGSHADFCDRSNFLNHMTGLLGHFLPK